MHDILIKSQWFLGSWIWYKTFNFGILMFLWSQSLHIWKIQWVFCLIFWDYIKNNKQNRKAVEAKLVWWNQDRMFYIKFPNLRIQKIVGIWIEHHIIMENCETKIYQFDSDDPLEFFFTQKTNFYFFFSTARGWWSSINSILGKLS